MKLVFRLVLGLAVLLVAAFFLLRTPDTDKEEMIAKYGSEASRFSAGGAGEEIHYRDEGNKDGPTRSVFLFVVFRLVDRLCYDYRWNQARRGNARLCLSGLHEFQEPGKQNAGYVVVEILGRLFHILHCMINKHVASCTANINISQS